jgi:four helix bundle protein
MIFKPSISPGEQISKADIIQDRLINYGVEVVKLCRSLPKTRDGRHIAGQLLRCATAGAPNYAEARAAESRQDFIHKLGIVLKELDGSLAWLATLRRLCLGNGPTVDRLADEGGQLARIIMASKKTAARNSLLERREQG